MPAMLRRRVALAVLAALALLATGPAAAAPVTLQFEGTLRSAGGGPAADGAYDLTFALYAQKDAKDPLWSEAQQGVKVAGGAVAVALGALKAIDAATLAEAAFVGVKVGADPELPRLPLHAVAFARRADVAADVACTGCISSAELAFDGDLDLGGHSLKAKNAVFSGDLSAKSVTAQTITGQQFVGDGSKLSGLWKASGSCKTGEAVVGIQVDGTLLCKAVGGAAAGGKLADVTGGLLSNEFVQAAVPAGLPLAIPDNTGAEAAAIATVSEAGSVQAVSVHVELKNSDLSKVRVVLLPPDDKVKGITLCDPCGAANAKSLATTYPDPTKPANGDLSAYVGKSAKGTWTLKVLDTSFCILQLPGNKELCNIDTGTDGAIVAYSVQVSVLSAKDVKVAGTFVAAGGLVLPTDPAPLPTCNAASKGLTYSDTKGARLLTCDGADWRTIPFLPACGNGIVSGDEECDDGNATETDACTKACKQAKCGDLLVHAGVEACDDGNTKDGDACAADCSKITGTPCSNGSVVDCQPAGQTLIASSAYVDPKPPDGWTQCLGFLNTAGDDVGPDAMGNCMQSTRLRLKVWDTNGNVVVDVWEQGLQSKGFWGGGQYYDGCNCGTALQIVTASGLWPGGNNAGFYGSNNGSCGGGSGGWNAGQCLSNGNGGQISLAPGQTNVHELSHNPSTNGYANYKVAVYR